MSDLSRESKDSLEQILTENLTQNKYIDYAFVGIILSIIFISIILFFWCCIKRCFHQKTIDQIGGHDIRNQSDIEAESDLESNYNEEKFKSDFIKINIKTPDGTIKPLPVLNTLTISMLKSLIAKHFNVPEVKQEIKYKHKRCDSAKQIGQLNIKNGDILQLIELNDGEIDIDNQVKITLKCQDHSSYTIYCSNLLRIRDFRKEVFAKIPVVPIHEQLLYFDDTELMDQDALLQEYGIDHDCVINFEWKKIDITLQ